MSEKTHKGIVSPAEILEKKIVYPIEEGSPIIVDGEHNQLQQVGIDLRLNKAFKVFGKANLTLDSETTIKPSLIEMQKNDNCYFFEANKQYSIDFMEDVEVPEDMAAVVVHRSTINRTIGTVVSGVYDPGFRSKGGCGAIFRPSVDVRIEVGYRMAQIVFFSAESASLYNGQYQAKEDKVEG